MKRIYLVGKEQELIIMDTDSDFLFRAAQLRLSLDPGTGRLSSVQARLAQCLYLLGTSRINECWLIFGTTTHLILALGLHRNRLTSMITDPIEREYRKNVFWSAYTLDR